MASYFVVGIILGCLYALTATGLVVTYTTSGIFNFAHGAIGMFMAFTYWSFTVDFGIPWPIAMALVLFVCAPLMGALIEGAFVRKLYGASLAVTLVVTLGLLLFLLFLAIWAWPNTTTRNLNPIWPGQVKIFGVGVSHDQIVILLVSVAVAAGLRVLFTRTRAGITMRAIVDDRDLTARVGASPARTAQLSWALGASLAALAGILIATAKLQQLDQFNLTILVIYGYAAAVFGKLKNLPMTVLGALLLGEIQSYCVGYLPVNLLSNFEPVIPLAVLFLVVLALPPERLRTARFGGRKQPRVPGLGVTVAAAGLFVVGAWVASGVLSAGNLLTFGSALTLGIVMLSWVLLTGFGGQVSLCQMTFAGVGAFCLGKMFGGASPVGLVAAVVLPAAVGGVLALVVLRLRGIYLALATLAFAYGMDNMFFNRYLGFGGILNVGRVGFHSQRAFLLEVAVLFAACGVGVIALRRGEFGRRLTAMTDSEVACASMGMNVTATKVMAFTLAAGIAGLGGAFYGGWQHQVGPNDFPWLASLTLLLAIAIAGLNRASGAFLAAVFYAMRPIIDHHALGHIPNFSGLLVGLGAVSLATNQGGVAGQLADAAETVRSRLRTGPAPSGGPASIGGPASDVSVSEEEVVGVPG